MNDSKVIWEKLTNDIRHLKPEALTCLVPLVIGTHAVIAPKESFEDVFRDVQTLIHEIKVRCESLSEAERGEKLRQFFFERKRFQVLTPNWPDLKEDDLLIKATLRTRIGHPLPMAIFYIHLAQAVGLSMRLVHAREHYILKWRRNDVSYYLDMLQQGRLLSESEVVSRLQKSASTCELWDARHTYQRYLEELIRLFEQRGQGHSLHSIYNLCLHLDEDNMSILAKRALLRHRMGFPREALTDLKRYFSFIDRIHAPIELQRVMNDLENFNEDMTGSMGFLH